MTIQDREEKTGKQDVDIRRVPPEGNAYGQGEAQVGADCRQPVPPGQMPFYRRKRLFAWVATGVIVLDQFTKWRIEEMMPLNTSQLPFPDLYPYFQLTHVANTGTAFGLLPQAKWIFTVLAFLVSLALAYLNYQLPWSSLKLRLAMGFLFGGAVGNLIDRIRLGHVTDFLNFNLRPLLQPVIDIPILDWPVFNVADMALSTGIALLAYILWRDPHLLDMPEEAES